MSDEPAQQPGLRLGVLQEQRLRGWPKDRIRPKSAALGVISLLAEVDALRSERDASSSRATALEVALAEYRSALERCNALALGAVSMFPPSLMEMSMVCRPLLAVSAPGRGAEILKAARDVAKTYDDAGDEGEGAPPHFAVTLAEALERIGRLRALVGEGEG